eukprot:7477841-Pyramimonas_sp.AAC.1
MPARAAIAVRLDTSRRAAAVNRPVGGIPPRVRRWGHQRGSSPWRGAREHRVPAEARPVWRAGGFVPLPELDRGGHWEWRLR